MACKDWRHGGAGGRAALCAAPAPMNHVTPVWRKNTGTAEGHRCFNGSCASPFGRHSWGLILRLCAALLISPVAPAAAEHAGRTPPAKALEVRIGVLAYRGPERALARWRPLMRYLSRRLAPHRFTAVPVTLQSAGHLLAEGHIDYLITNPGHYVSLSARLPLAAIATLKRPLGDGGLVRFGCVIFSRADNRDIQTLADLRGRSLAAVAPDAFGGFQMAWKVLRDQRIDPFTDLRRLHFTGFPQDRIVSLVLSGKADAGVVRTGLIEMLAREGKLDPGRLRILNRHAPAGFPFRVSSPLYPEWPFVARIGVPHRLSEDLATALYATNDDRVRRAHGLKVAWTVPQPYAEARRLVAAYEAWRKRQGAPRGAGHWWWALLAAGAALAALGLLVLRRRRAPQGAAVATSPNDAAPAGGQDLFGGLTAREREVLRLLCRGRSSKEIARALAISPKTVEHHRASLLKKTGAHSTTRLVWLATRHGFDRGRDIGEIPRKNGGTSS